MHSPRRALRALSLFWAGLACGAARPAAAQDWFRTGTGLGVSQAARGRGGFCAAQAPTSQPLATLFSDVVRNDLDYSGILDLVSKSFYPTQVPSVPAELNYQAWSGAPVSAQFLAFGNLTATGTTAGDSSLVQRRAE